MNKKLLMASMAFTLILSAIIPAAFAITLQRPDHMITADVGEPESCDPGYLYDSASMELLRNCYDYLIRFKVDRTQPDPFFALVDQFSPCIATDWGIEGAETATPSYWFEIRTGVEFHDGSILVPYDVEYSLERWIMMDRDGGAAWLLMEPLLGYGEAPCPPRPGATPATATAFATALDNAIESNSTHVWLDCQLNYGIIVLQTLAQPWGGILDKDWVVGLTSTDFPTGGFPGFDSTGHTWANWQAWHNTDPTEIDALAGTPAGGAIMGTGPYEFDHWTHGTEWYITRFTDYWGPWPAEDGLGGNLPGYIDKVTYKFIDEWAVRRDGFVRGDYDLCYVPDPYRTQILGKPGIRYDYPLPSLTEFNYFFGFVVDPETVYAGGPGGHGFAYDTYGETGIPRNFFNNTETRLGFAYAWPGDDYIRDVLMTDAVMPATYHIPALAHYNPPPGGTYWYDGLRSGGSGSGPEPYHYNLTRAEYYLKIAAGGSPTNAHEDPSLVTSPGSVWTNGFTFTLTYVAGVTEWETASEMFRAAVESLNAKFHIDVVGLEWGSLFLPALTDQELVLFDLGWGADYPHPHNFAYPYFHTQGTFTWCQNYRDDTIYTVGPTYVDKAGNTIDMSWTISGTSDDLMGAAVMEANETRAEAMYFYLQQLFHDNVVDIPTDNPTGWHWERRWVQGWYSEPIMAGNFFRYMWKALEGDVDGDNDCDATDLTRVILNYGNVPIDPGWDEAADIDEDDVGDLDDLYIVLADLPG
jgi:peptide/nickel transport system substrate-binding protein